MRENYLSYKMKLLRALPPEEAEQFLALSVDPDLVRDDCGNFERYGGVSRAESCAERVKILNGILKDSIAGFHRFYNFTSKGFLRVGYNWNYDGGLPFDGVGYIMVTDVVRGHFGEAGGPV